MSSAPNHQPVCDSLVSVANKLYNRSLRWDERISVRVCQLPIVACQCNVRRHIKVLQSSSWDVPYRQKAKGKRRACPRTGVDSHQNTWVYICILWPLSTLVYPMYLFLFLFLSIHLRNEKSFPYLKLMILHDAMNFLNFLKLVFKILTIQKW